MAVDPELEYGTQERLTHIANTANEWAGAGTYEPRTETGRGYVETVGETLGPLEAVEPMMVGGGMIMRLEGVVPTIEGATPHGPLRTHRIGWTLATRLSTTSVAYQCT